MRSRPITSVAVPLLTSFNRLPDESLRILEARGVNMRIEPGIVPTDVEIGGAALLALSQ